MGPCSSITCVKFNPNIYKLPKGEIVSVFAMGDAQGNIAVWMIGDKYRARKPVVLLKSSLLEDTIVENLEWSAKGDVLIATTFSPYLITACFE